MAHPRGFGFVRVEELEEDIFIHGKHRHHAFHEDQVEIRILSQGNGDKGPEGEVVRILSHSVETVVGTYFAAKKHGAFFIPDNQKLPSEFKVVKRGDLKAKTRDKVVLKITDYGASGKPEGEVIEILGKEYEPGVDILSIARSFGLSTEFPDKVITQGDRLNKPVFEGDLNGRNDYRELLCVTIDGEHSKDFDDAVSLTVEDGEYLLGVHIADVANYVQEGSALDVEAKKRGNSAYLLNIVLPMLPESLSNGICSLNEGVERLTLSCMMRFTKEGELISHEISESVIISKRRMTYTEVNQILTDKKKAKEYDKELVTMLKGLHKLSKTLRKKRRKRGAVEFDFPECEITLDKKGHPVEIGLREANEATRLIEDCMLAANETVAAHFHELQMPMAYRYHGEPDPERVSQLFEMLGRLGVSLRTKGGKLSPRDVQRLLDKVKGKPEEPLVSMLTLRSMQRAIYNEKHCTHFGLAAEHYLHFTSPIRRYPDLFVHRIIKHILRNRMNEDRKVHYEDIVHGVCEHCSATERAAEEAERECDKLKKCEYMADRYGEVFTGRISGMIDSGFYVELPNSVEGMVGIRDLKGDRYYFRKDIYCIEGERTKRRFNIGDEVKVYAVSVNPYARTIDFELA